MTTGSGTVTPAGPANELLEYVCGFVRAETDDPIVPGLIAAAEEYIASAGIDAATAEPDLYRLAVALFVSNMFSGGESKLEPALHGILHQIRA